MNEQKLIAAGWSQTRSGRWHHEAFDGEGSRRRLFTEGEALAQLTVNDIVGTEPAPAAEVH